MMHAIKQTWRALCCRAMGRRAIASICAATAAVIDIGGISARAAEAPPRPNILWLTSEDHGPHLGCYGDPDAQTPNVDGLARKGMIYRRVWSCAPVCAPARTTLISGLYPPSTGAESMRSMVAFPAGMKMFPQLLRDAGYYATNNAKEDYNLSKPGKVWDESSRQAHWKNRPAGRPFFAVFNSEKSHESRIRSHPNPRRHDPAKVRVPAYHPDTPQVREDWARYHDNVSAADSDAGRRLEELAAAGLAEDTIVFYFADHGPGMPRCKRTAMNSGLGVPLVVHIPEKFKALRPADYRAGGRSERLVSFIDFAPTVLSLAGIEPPAWMQGAAFLGPHQRPSSRLAFGFRGRMDERIDLVRSATNGRYVYVRNYMPHRIPGQHVSYMFETSTTRIWHQLFEQGKLTPAQSSFWKPKPPEELYDLRDDPDEVSNLANSPAHQPIVRSLRRAQQSWARRIRDVGFLPEGEIRSRSADTSPYEMGRDENRFSFERVIAAAELASLLHSDAIPMLRTWLTDPNSAVRYWAALGLLMRGEPAVRAAKAELAAALGDRSPYVRMAAAEALARFGTPDDRERAIAELLRCANWNSNDVFTVISALNSLGESEVRSPELQVAIQRLPAKGPVPDPRYASYVPRLLQHLRDGGNPLSQPTN